MIDIHCHILPNLDDGAKDIDESCQMARIAASDGIKKVVATPHTLNNSFLNTVDNIQLNLENLKDLFEEKQIEVQLYEGADVRLCADIMGKINSGEACTISNNRKYILLELPDQFIPPITKQEIFNLRLNGITPIITHPERHLIIQEDIDILDEFVQMGALCQVTAMSVTGEFGEKVLDCTKKIFKRGLVHIIASDAHSSNYRSPILSRSVEAAAKILGSYNEAEYMVTKMPEKIIRKDN